MAENQGKRMAVVKRWYDARKKPLLLEAGDWVLLSVHSHPKLESLRKHNDRYVGPFVISEKVHDNTYRLAGLPPGVPHSQNVQYLKLFCPPPSRFQG